MQFLHADNCLEPRCVGVSAPVPIASRQDDLGKRQVCPDAKGSSMHRLKYGVARLIQRAQGRGMAPEYVWT